MIRKKSSHDYELDDDIEQIEDFIERRKHTSPNWNRPERRVSHRDNKLVENHYYIEEPPISPAPATSESKSWMTSFFSSGLFNSIIFALLSSLVTTSFVLYDKIKKFEYDSIKYNEMISDLKQDNKNLNKEIVEIKTRLTEFETTLMNIYRKK
jgi:hypothetical protein